jgi:hypothetical protein
MMSDGEALKTPQTTRTGYLFGAAAVAGTAVLGQLASKASLLPGLLFWVAVCQGAILIMAAADMARSKWHLQIRPVILSLHPLLFIFPLAFIFFSLGGGTYGWEEHPTRWLSEPFFTIRNVALLLLTAVVGRFYARAAQRGARSIGTLAVIYGFVFAANQTLIAFDWVMSLEAPWISTLFGAYFFVEAMYVGIGASIILTSILMIRHGERHLKTLNDFSTLLFGFSLLWVGQFFAQYLVIWYGNLPHEVVYLSRRVLEGPLRIPSVFVVLALFAIPFIILLSRSAKKSPLVSCAMAALVAAGVFVERLVFLIPDCDLNVWVVALEMLLLGAAFVFTARAALQRESV